VAKLQNNSQIREFFYKFFHYLTIIYSTQSPFGPLAIVRSPAISKKAMLKIKTEIRSWNLNCQTHLSIEQIAERINPIVSGWMEGESPSTYSTLWP